MSYHIHNGDFMNNVGLPSQAKRGDTFTLPAGLLGFEGPACRGSKSVPIPSGSYVIVSRKYFRGGTQEIKPG